MSVLKVRRRVLGHSVYYSALALLCLLTLLPLLWTFIISIKPPAELFSKPFSLIFKPSFNNYHKALYGTQFRAFFVNSFIVAISSAFLSMLITVPGAYVSARFGTGGQLFKQWVLSVWFLPPIVAAVPIYLAERKIGILDTHIALIIPYLLIDMPLAFLLSTSFISGVPKELDEAALVDGCTQFQAFWKVIFPLSLPGLLVTFAFCFMFAWNEYFFALLISGTRVMTLPVHITSYLSIHSIGWGEVAAVGVIITVPMLILLIVIQKYLIKGLTLGALQ